MYYLYLLIFFKNFIYIYIWNYIHKAYWIHKMWFSYLCIYDWLMGIRINCWGSHPWGWPVAFLKIGPCEISTVYNGMSTDIIMQVLFMKPYCWDFICVPSLISHPDSLTLKIFSPLFLRVPWLKCRVFVVDKNNWGEYAKVTHLSVFWPVVFLLWKLHLLQKEISLM